MPWATIEHNVRLPLTLTGRRGESRAEDADVARVLDLVGLRDFAQSYPWQLSGGMKMRASLARALVTAPDFLLLDEPFAALGVEQTRRGLDMIRAVAAQGIGVVIITHIMQQAFQVADRIVVIRHGVVAGDVARNQTSPDAVVGMITGETAAGAGPAG